MSDTKTNKQTKYKAQAPPSTVLQCDNGLSGVGLVLAQTGSQACVVDSLIRGIVDHMFRCLFHCYSSDTHTRTRTLLHMSRSLC